MDDLIEHFRDKERRKEFFKEFKEMEMLYEIISPDAFLRPYIDDYTSLSAIYAVVAKAYAKTGVRRQGVPAEDERAGAEARRRTIRSRRSRLRRDQRRNTIDLIKQQARRRRHEGHQPDQEHRENGEEESGRPVPDRDGRAGQGGPGELRGPANVNGRGTGRAVQARSSRTSSARRSRPKKALMGFTYFVLCPKALRRRV